jgi:hypothetical protein
MAIRCIAAKLKKELNKNIIILNVLNYNLLKFLKD